MRLRGSIGRERRESRAEKALDYAVETRRAEIDRFWTRSLFFWGFIGAAFVAYSNEAQWRAKIAICCFGMVASLAWTLQNRGAKYWQEAWEHKVRRLERAVLGHALFHSREPRQRKGWWGAWHFSVSAITIALSDFTLLIWLALTAAIVAPGISCAKGDIAVFVGLSATALFCVAMFLATWKRKSDFAFASDPLEPDDPLP